MNFVCPFGHAKDSLISVATTDSNIGLR